jgi:alpha-amylase
VALEALRAVGLQVYADVVFNHKNGADGVEDVWAQQVDWHGWGDQHDYFDHPRTIGWFRTGDAAHPGQMAVAMTNGTEGSKWMNTFRPGAVFRDVTGHHADTITANASGWANFRCNSRSVSVWVS